MKEKKQKPKKINIENNNEKDTKNEENIKAENTENTGNKTKKRKTINGISIWRILAYFIIYWTFLWNIRLRCSNYDYMFTQISQKV